MEINDTINNRYVIEQIIGNGTFGNIYKAKCIKKQIYYAIKTEAFNAQFNTLSNECNILKYLYDNRCRSIPSISWYGLHKTTLCLVTPLYDMTLTEYLQQNNFSRNSLYKLFPKMINLMQSIHELHVLHRDIKPDNFMVKNNELFLIDFGLSKVCIDENSQYIKNIQQTEITGNIRFCSYYIMTGNTPAIRDDIISLGFLFLYILTFELPWDHVPIIEDEHYPRNHIMNARNQEIAELKHVSSIKKFAASVDKNMVMYFQYIYSISYHEYPCYDAVKNLFTSTLLKNNINNTL